MKILNLYAGIGGNRKGFGVGHTITAVELDEKIASVYAFNFPDDNLVIGDAHEYLLRHFKEFDFIWSSPPCQSHSSFRQNICVRFRGTKPEYPDMRLYQEILFLRYNFDGIWAVENVKPYYEPLIKPDAVLERHLFWTNMEIPPKEFEKDNIRTAQIPQLEAKYEINTAGWKIQNRRQVLRNCVEPKIAEHILIQAEHNFAANK